MLLFCIMAAVSVQLNMTTRAYEALIKDKAIIAAEVLHEYDEKARISLSGVVQHH